LDEVLDVAEAVHQRERQQRRPIGIHHRALLVVLR
jgi:hypothetical protein